MKIELALNQTGPKSEIEGQMFWFKEVRATTSVQPNFSVYFILTTYFFYFTRPLLQNSHIRISIIHS